MIEHIQVEQGSEEWHRLRCGLVTASEFGAVLAKGQGKTRAAYLRRVVAERLTGKVAESYSNAHMQRGSEQEALARLAYEARSDLVIESGGFFRNSDLKIGCSPDGLIGDDGGIEIKCAIPTTQVEALLRGAYPPEHGPQVQGCLWLTGRKWWDFVSFCPDMPAPLRCYIFRVERDDAYIRTLEAEVLTFVAEVDKVVACLNARAAR